MFWAAMLSNVTVFCFFASYLTAVAFEAGRAARGVAWLRWPAVAAAAAGLVAHTAFLLERAHRTNLPPLLSSTQDWLLVVAWIAAVLYLFLTAYDRRASVGVFLLPLVLLLVAVAAASSDATTSGMRTEAVGRGAFREWVLLHAALLGLGIAAVVCGLVFSLMYLVQHHRLRTKRVGPGAMKLLSLERLARWNRAAVLLGVPLLGLGFAVGFALGPFTAGRGVSLRDPVVIGSCVAWLVGIVILGRTLREDRPAGRAVAVRTLTAFGILLGTLLGLQLVTGGEGHAVGTREKAAARSDEFDAEPVGWAVPTALRREWRRDGMSAVSKRREGEAPAEPPREHSQPDAPTRLGRSLARPILKPARAARRSR